MSGVENAALFERLMEIHSNPPILYFGFNRLMYTWDTSCGGLFPLLLLSQFLTTYRLSPRFPARDCLISRIMEIARPSSTS